MDAGNSVFEVIKSFPLAVIAVVCLCRAAKLDNRARRPVMYTLLLLSMAAFGELFSMFMPQWMADACWAGLAWAVCLMLVEGEKRWRGGPPDELFRDEERYPTRERRARERRQGQQLHRAAPG